VTLLPEPERKTAMSHIHSRVAPHVLVLSAFLLGGCMSGGPRAVDALPDDASPETAAALARFQVFDEESAWTYEAGFKGFALDRRVSADIALFWINWDDQQLTRTESYFRTNGSTFARSLIQNAGSSRIRGIELDLNARVTDWLDLRLGYAYTDARITDFVDEVQEDLFDTDGLVGALNPGNDPDGQTKGNRLPQQPLHQLILSGEINRDLNADWTLFTRLDGVYESKRYAQVHNLAHGGDSFLLNARLGAETGNWMVTMFVDNLLNDKTPPVVSRFVDFFQTIRIPDRLNPAATQTVLGRDMLAAHPRKRSYGVTVSYRF
jgi:outer membrane receptor protein involved in Fe transport